MNKPIDRELPNTAPAWLESSQGDGALSGVRVLDLTELLPGPFLTQNMLELGADVIKIERPPHGDNTRVLSPGLFNAVNRGKRSAMLNLKHDGDRAQVIALAAQADVLVESYRPGVMARLGLDEATLRERNPGLIYASLSGYGATGPWAMLPGHDINYLAGAGIVGLSGALGGEPAQTFGAPVADLAGSTYALAAINAALFQRTRTGRGQFLDVSLTDCMVHWMNVRRGVFAHAGTQSIEQQREIVLRRPAYGVFRCADGRYLTLAAIEQHFWLALTELFDLGPEVNERWGAYSARREEAEEINRRIALALAEIDRDDAIQRMLARDIPALELVEPNDLAQVAHFRERGLFDVRTEPPMCRFPVAIDGMPTRK